ncbi:hypothetical protein DHEL01_v203560 [Diaporthe helianthi]|uniref:Uncharacterized protein n=1 Tax=Diaporthe helianthi TaxID=158607 RepID=A0A2P5I6C1_DIAHE|nr:hypothetical protein DHEL01_v203560 [Diaporthe helianthi]
MPASTPNNHPTGDTTGLAPPIIFTQKDGTKNAKTPAVSTLVVRLSPVVLALDLAQDPKFNIMVHCITLALRMLEHDAGKTGPNRFEYHSPSGEI